MMLVLLVVGLLALVQSASVVPIDSSSINVKHSGQDYSYTIKENHGIAIEPYPHHQIPVIRIAPDNNIKHEHLPINEQEMRPIQGHGKTPTIAGIAYSTPVAVVPTYSYLPAHQYPIPYGINYPYNLITTF